VASTSRAKPAAILLNELTPRSILGSILASRVGQRGSRFQGSLVLRTVYNYSATEVL
jgi:hypothetical protein